MRLKDAEQLLINDKEEAIITQPINGCNVVANCKIKNKRKSVSFTYEDPFTWKRGKQRLLLKPIGYVEKKDHDKFWNLSSSDFYIDIHFLFTHDYFYNKCEKRGCKLSDIFYVVDGPDNVVGKFIIPAGSGYDLYFIEVKVEFI